MGCWNIRTMSEIGKVYQIAYEMNRYQISILDLSETRQNGQGKIRLIVRGVNSISYSAYADEDAKKGCWEYYRIY